MPNRILRDGVLDSRAVSALTDDGQILFYRLMSIADDYGRYHADPELIRAKCFPLLLDRWPLSRVANALTNLNETKVSTGVPLVVIYGTSSSTNKYLQIEGFGQRTRTPSKFPDPSVRELVVAMRTNVSNDVTNASTVPPNADISEQLQASRARTHSHPTTPPHAEVFEVLTVPPARDVDESPSYRFDEWWNIWSRVKGTNQRMAAETVYPREVTVALEEDCFACTESYLQSLDNPAKGYNPHNFLIDQKRDKYKARWPIRSRSPSKPSLEDRTLALWQSSIEKGESPL